MSAAALLRSARSALAVLLVAFPALAAAADRPAYLVQSLALPGATSRQAEVYRPTQAREPWPVVLALQGCSGLQTQQEREAHRQSWGEWLARHGYLVVFADSHATDGLASTCHPTPSSSAVVAQPVMAHKDEDSLNKLPTAVHLASTPWHTLPQPVQELLALKTFLQSLPGVDPQRLYLMGWARGGASVLQAVQPQAADPTALSPDFAGAIVFYPGCAAISDEDAQPHARLPTTLFIGSADTWGPAATCQALVRAAQANNEPMGMVRYHGAYHAFDHPQLSPRRRSGLTTATDGSDTLILGSHPRALADARQRVLALLGHSLIGTHAGLSFPAGGH